MKHPSSDHPLRLTLINATLGWEQMFGVAPAITSAISEFDAAMLMGHSPESYAEDMRGATAVRKGFDFRLKGKRYQVKANRPSGKPGSTVTRVGKANNFEWDFLVWILYDEAYIVQEAWQWDVKSYRGRFSALKRLSPSDMRVGVRVA